MIGHLRSFHMNIPDAFEGPRDQLRQKQRIDRAVNVMMKLQDRGLRAVIFAVGRLKIAVQLLRTEVASQTCSNHFLGDLLPCDLSVKTVGTSQPGAVVLVEWFKVLMLESEVQSVSAERETVSSCDEVCHH